jgi:hypothetical protein
MRILALLEKWKQLQTDDEVSDFGRYLATNLISEVDHFMGDIDNYDAEYKRLLLGHLAWMKDVIEEFEGEIQ